MNEDLKYGEKYRLELLCKSQTKNIIVFETPTGGLLPLDVNDLECVSPIPERENTESAHKYAPCRLFKEGDIVEPCQVKGRWFGSAWKNRSGMRFTVTKREDEEGVMWVQDPDSLHAHDVEAVFFQLVTPVEELEPYKVNHVKELELFEVCHYEMGDDTIEKEGELNKIVRTIYWYGKRKLDRTEEEAKAEAEAERDRLNEAYRKEKSNG